MGLIIAAALLAPFGPPCAAPTGYESLEISASVAAGTAFELPFADRFTFALAPTRFGWTIVVAEAGREEDLARLTPPWHFVPNPRLIEGWHFRNASNTGPNDGSVNAPQAVRDFIFSPEVGRTLDYEGSATSAAVVDEVRRFGQGRLSLTEFNLTPISSGERASFEDIRFDLCLLWRTDAL